MILLDTEAQQRPKFDSLVAGTTNHPSELVTGCSHESTQAQYSVINIFCKYSPYKFVGSRFRRAILYVLAIYVVLSITIGIPFLIKRVTRRSGFRPPHFDNSSSLSTPLDYANAGLFAMNRTCNAWDTSDAHSASASYILEPKGSFSIRSTAWQEAASGSNTQIYGNLTVDINPDPSALSAIFNVTISSSTSQSHENALICFSDDDNDRGLEIYIPYNLTKSDSFFLNVTLLFPSTSSHSLNNLVTYLPMFSQRIGTLAPQLGFDQVELEGSGMDIHCDSLQARKIAVKNSLAAITGTYNVTSKLKLDTVGAPINANITLVQDHTSGAPTFFSLDTGNHEINADIVLLANPSEFALHPISYMGLVKNFNGPLFLDIKHHSLTPSAALDLLVENNQAESKVTLDDKYVGNFDIQTKLATANVDWGDLSGRNGKKTLVYDDESSTRRRGWVGWSSRPEKWNPHTEGIVRVVSSLSPIMLQFR